MIGQDIICISTQDFDDLWTRKQRWMTRLASANRVLYVEAQVHWLTVLRRWPQYKSRLSARNRALRQVHPNLSVWTPPIVWPFFQMWEPISHINNARLGRSLRSITDALGFHDPILWLYTPYSADLIDALRPKRTIYECVDDFAAARGLIRPSVVRRLEDETFRRADLTIATAPSLTAHASRVTRKWRLSPNACDVAFFSQAAEHGSPIDPLIADLPQPILGFVGAVAYWVDLDLLAELARSRPETTIVLVGPVRVNIKKYQSIPNLRYFGPVDYDRLPGVVRGFDVCLNPYKNDDLARGASPLKLYEYLATGKPIVSTSMPEAERFADVVRIAPDRGTFVAACDAALSESRATRQERQSRQMGLSRSHTWDSRFEEVERWIGELLTAESESECVPAAHPRRLHLRRPAETRLASRPSTRHVVVNALSITGPQLAGGFTYLTSLLPPMIAANLDTKFTILVTRSAARHFAYTDRNVALHVLPDRLLRGPLRAWYERRMMAVLLRRLNADVYLLPYGFLPVRPPCPTVLVCQNLYFLHSREYKHWRPPSIWWRLYEGIRTPLFLRHWRRDLSVANRIIAVSQTVAGELVHHLGADAGKIRVAPHGVAAPFTSESDSQADDAHRLRLGIGRDYFLSVGALAPNKNLDLLLTAYRCLLHSDPGCPDLVLAGPDWRGLSAQVNALCQTLRIESRVHWTGLVDAVTLAALYRGAVATIQLSTCEAFGLPALEAMACGSPVVVADRSGLAEVGGEAAIPVDPVDPVMIAQVLRLLDGKPAWRRRWIDRGMARAQQFTWQQAAESTYAAIAEAAGWTADQTAGPTPDPSVKCNRQLPTSVVVRHSHEMQQVNRFVEPVESAAAIPTEMAAHAHRSSRTLIGDPTR